MGAAIGAGALFNGLYNAPSAAQAYTSDNALLTPPRTNKVFDHQFRSFKLGEVINLAEDVAIFRFLLPEVDDEFSLLPCSTLQSCFKSGAMVVEQVQRFYTPITKNGTKGYFDILVKKQHDGRMTEHLFSMEVGESLFFRSVQYKLKYKPNRWSHVGMIGGGTGITPLYQVIQHASVLPQDKTKLSLLYANQTENKILLKGCLDEYEKEMDGRFKATYIVDKAEDPENWKGPTGFITKALIKETMPAPAENIMVMVCGPDKMMTHICGAPFGVLKAMSGGLPWQPSGGNLNNFADVEGLLGELGYLKEMVYRF
jgi:cytochrome-b5 reductase